MDKENLLESAKKIPAFGEAACEEYTQKQEQLTNKMNRLMLQREDIEQLIGEGNEQMMQDNHANHARFIASILKNYNPDVLVDTVLWVFRAYRSHQFTTNYWAAQLNTWISVLKEELSPQSYAEIYPLYEWMQVNIPLFVKLSDEKLENAHSMH